MKKCCTWIDGTRIQLKNMQIIMLFCLYSGDCFLKTVCTSGFSDLLFISRKRQNYAEGWETICLWRVGKHAPVGHELQRLSNWFSRMKVTVSIWEMTLPSSLSSLRTPTPPSATPGHESENVTPQRMGSRSAVRRRTERERGRDEDRRRGARWDNQYLWETWPGRAPFMDQELPLKTTKKPSN